MIVYHGSYTEIKKPQILQTNRTKDFGPGFYCTIIKEQAERWSRKFSEGNFVNFYNYHYIDGLDVLEFSEMTDEWLDFIVACRNGYTHNHDIVIGAMADDQIYNYISQFLNGTLLREQFWVMMKFKYPTHQIAFCSEKSLQCISFLKSEVINAR